MTTISTKTILRSRNASAPEKVLSSLLARYPRWIHAEQRTHRIIPLCEEEEVSWAPSTPSLMADPNLSRNAGSSRAIPVAKLIADVEADPAVPLFWGKNVAGMQARDELPKHLAEKAESIWLKSMEDAIRNAKALQHLAEDEGEVIATHKQIVNRLLEPFSHITVVISATEWSNFLELRDHPDAEPHIQILAREIRKCLEEAPIQTLEPGQWHLPFVDRAEVDTEVLKPYLLNGDTSAAHMPEEEFTAAAIKLSVARCASTSYKTVDGFDMTLDRAVELHDKLVGSRPIHASPCEHVAQADTFQNDRLRNGKPQGWWHPTEHGNFQGFRQYRRQLELAA